MPKFKILVDDVDKAHEAHIESYKLHPHIQKQLRNGSKRPKGTVHTEAEAECPNGLPNCRNCGDPEYLESCKAAGHCPDCGIKHGIAPDSIIKKNGYRLVES